MIGWHTVALRALWFVLVLALVFPRSCFVLTFSCFYSWRLWWFYIGRIYPGRLIIRLRRIIRLAKVNTRRIKMKHFWKCVWVNTRRIKRIFFFAALRQFLRHRLNFFFPSSNFTLSCTCWFFKLSSNFHFMCSETSLFEDFLKDRVTRSTRKPSSLKRTDAHTFSSSFVHLPSFPLDNSLFLVAILITA